MEVQQKVKTLDLAISQIEKQFGQGAIMRMGEDTIIKIEGISTGSLSLDVAIGIGGAPRGELLKFMVQNLQEKQHLLYILFQKLKKQEGLQHLLMQNMPWIPNMQKN